jgi:hypothetical protein
MLNPGAMKLFLLLVSAFLVLTISTLNAAPKPKVPARVVYIAIVSVDPPAMTITVELKNSMSTEKKMYKVTNATVVKVNGNTAALIDLKPDMQIHFHLAADGITADDLSASPAPE